MTPQRDPVLVFDVNETLLDLAGLDAYFADVFGDASVRREWFAGLLHAAMVHTITGRYATFGEIGLGCLRSLGTRRGANIGDAEEKRLLEGLTSLPPHGDVPAALDRLKRGGFRLAALTNSTLAVARAQLGSAGLSAAFDEILSADEVRRLKPAPEPYQHAARRLGIGVGGMMMVAAHGWDVAGALATGARAAFVARPGQMTIATAPPPELVASDFVDLVDRLRV